ncbi:MAG: hypothetical protein ACI9Z3_001081 [Roseivirga sp.]|jgi:hypothetical protein
MLQVPEEYWKEMLKQGNLVSDWVKEICSKEDIAEALNKDYKEQKLEFEHAAISAFYDFGVLYIEQAAITQYIKTTQNFFSNLRDALPEICCLAEVFEWYKKEHMRELTPLQMHQVELMIYRAVHGSIEYII